MTAFHTNNIDALRATPLANGSGWAITFHSAHAGYCHQLYVNGSLVAWTDTPAGRRFVLDADYAPALVAVVAVELESRTEEFSEELPSDASSPSWVHEFRVLRELTHRAGDDVRILGDQATGLGATVPLGRVPLWPGWMPRWAFGEDAFGQGGFGYDGCRAVGLQGLFGIGGFGFDLDAVSVPVAMGEEGAHELLAETIASDGQTAQGASITVEATPPPRPVDTLRTESYDATSNTLTLNIESD